MQHISTARPPLPALFPPNSFSRITESEGFCQHVAISLGALKIAIRGRFPEKKAEGSACGPGHEIADCVKIFCPKGEFFQKKVS